MTSGVPGPAADKGVLARSASLLALRRNVSLLLIMLVLVGLSEKLFLRFIPKYLSDLGAGPLIVGAFGFMQNALSAVYALPGGYITDRLGHYRSLLFFVVLNLVGYALLAMPAWQAVLVAVLFCSAWSQLSLPATFSLIADELPTEKRVMGLAVQGVIRRVPMALGPLIGGYIFAYAGLRLGMRIAVILSALLTLLAARIHLWYFQPARSRAAHQELHPLELWRTFRPQLKRLLASDILIRFCEQIPDVFVVLWVTERLGRSTADFGVLSAIEMAMAASLYIPIALWVDRRVRLAQAEGGHGEGTLPVTERKPFVITTFCFFTAFPVFLYFAHGWWGLVLAFAVRGLKEFGEPARKATIVDLAQEGLKARTVGLYYTIRDLTVAFAALGGGVLYKLAPASNLWTAFGFGVLGTILYAMSGNIAETQRKEPVG